jgi:type II secretory pathway pseudopilin PulG
MIEPTSWEDFLQWANRQGFAWRDILGQDRWNTFTPVFGALTVVGAPNYTGRFRTVGRAVEFQVVFSAATSIASTAGTDYLTLPIQARGSTGIAVMTNDSTNIAVGVCHLDVSTSRCYLPTQAASADVFNLCGSYET